MAEATSKVLVDMRRKNDPITGRERYAESIFLGLCELNIYPVAAVEHSRGLRQDLRKRIEGRYSSLSLATGPLFHLGLARAFFGLPAGSTLVSPLGFIPAVFTHRVAAVVYDSASWQVGSTDLKSKLLERSLRGLAEKRGVCVAISRLAAAELSSSSVPVLSPPLWPEWKGGSTTSFPERRGILAVGTLNERKRFDRILEAYSRLADPPHLTIVGRDGGQRAVLERLAEVLNISGRVRFLGAIEDSTLRELYRSSALLVNGSDYEGLYLPMLEAMASGLPVVTTPVGIASDWVCPNHIADFDPDSLAQTVQRVLGDPAEWQRASTEGLSRVQGLSPAATAADLIAALPAEWAPGGRSLR